MRKDVKVKGFTLMEIVLVVALIGILLRFAVPNITKFRQNADLMVIKHDSVSAKTLLVSDLLIEDSSIIEGRVTNTISEKSITKDKKINNKIFLNGENKSLKDNNSVSYELDLINKDINDGSLYKLKNDYLIDGTGTSLKGDFFANTGGEIYYISGKTNLGIDENDISLDNGGNSSVGGSCEDAERLEEEISALNSKIKTTKEKIELAKKNSNNKEKEDLLAEVSKLEKESMDLKKELQDLLNSNKNELALKNKELQELKDKKLELQGIDKTGEINELNLKIEAMEKEIEQIKEDHKLKVDDLNKKIEKAKSEIISKKEELSGLKKKKADLELEVQSLTEELEGLEKEIAAKSKELEELTATHEAKTSELNEIYKINQERLDKANEDIAKMTSERDLVKTDLDKISSEVANLEKQLSDIEANDEKLKRDIEVKKKTLDELKLVLEEKNSTIGKLDKQIATLKEVNSNLLSEISEITESNKVLEQTATELRASIDKIKEDHSLEMTEKNKEVKRLADEKAGLDKSIKGLEGDITSLNKEIDAKTKELDSKIASNKQKTEEISNLTKDIASKESKKSELVASKISLESKKKELSDSVAKITEQINTHNTSIEKLNSDIEALKKSKENIQSSIEIVDSNNNLLFEMNLVRLEIDAKYAERSVVGLNITELEKNTNEVVEAFDASGGKYGTLNIQIMNNRIHNIKSNVNNLKEIQASHTNISNMIASLNENSGEDDLNLIESEIDKMIDGVDKKQLQDIVDWVRSVLIEKEIIHVSLGIEHSSAITTSGEIFTWGNGEYGRLGHGDDSASKNIPKQVEALKGKKVVQVSLGGIHSAAITDNGELFTWGYGNNGMLGHDNSSDSFTPKQVEALKGKKVIQVSLGGIHSAAITDNGELFTWGRGHYGRLGHDNSSDSFTPKQVEALKGKKVIQVSLGDTHSAAITDNGELYTWGDGNNSRLGHGDTERQLTPKQVEALRGKKIIQVSLGGAHSALITSNGQLYTWGKGSYGRLGHGSDKDDKKTPEQVEGLKGKKVVQISFGDSHSAVITDDGQLYTWGKGSDGILGHGDTVEKNTPKQVEALSNSN